MRNNNMNDLFNAHAQAIGDISYQMYGRDEVNKYEIHKKLCDILNEIYIAKNKDYGDSFGQSYREEGMAMVRIRLGDKFNRLKTLTRNPDSQMVKDESIRDTLMDLANYAIMTIVEMEIENDRK